MRHLRAIWSVHDVSPATIERCARHVAALEAHGIAPIQILVVPAGDWPEAAIGQLRAWAASGHELVAHGWSHRAHTPRDLGHRLHALLISRDAGEHLGLSRAEVAALVRQSTAWFAAHDLSEPSSYVPPAWALGRLPARAYGRFGIRTVESLTGFIDTRTGRRTFLPLAGFEADTTARAVSLRALNWTNFQLARATGRPIRVAVHPFDDELRLASDLERWMQLPWEPVLAPPLARP